MKTIIANWKNNLSVKEAEVLLEAILSRVVPKELAKCNLIIASSYLSLPILQQCLKQHHPRSKVSLSAQDVSVHSYGAFTSQVCADDISSFASYTIIGHSESRMYLDQSDQNISEKIAQALRANLKVVLCVGENYQQRMDGLSYVVVADQVLADLSNVSLEELRSISIAYEPIWSISTSEHAIDASLEEINKMNTHIRQILVNSFKEPGEHIPLLYGGSVSMDNIEQYIDIDDCSGYLVGGASLRADGFSKMIDFVIQSSK
jgi:triosephosphate isomerase